jgi:hypothetical protein
MDFEYKLFYSLQSTVYSLQSTVYSLQSTVYSLQSKAMNYKRVDAHNSEDSHCYRLRNLSASTFS